MENPISKEEIEILFKNLIDTGLYEENPFVRSVITYYSYKGCITQKQFDALEDILKMDDYWSEQEPPDFGCFHDDSRYIF